MLRLTETPAAGCLASLPAASKNIWGNKTIKLLFRKYNFFLPSLQHASNSSAWDTQLQSYNVAVPTQPGFEGFSGDLFSYYVPGLLLGSPIHCLHKIGVLQNWASCWRNSCKESEESWKIKDNKMLLPFKLSFKGHMQRGAPPLIVCLWAGKQGADFSSHTTGYLRLGKPFRFASLLPQHH